MHEHHLYAFSAASEYYLRERLLEAQRDRLEELATARDTRPISSSWRRRIANLRFRLLARVAAAVAAVLLLTTSIASAQSAAVYINGRPLSLQQVRILEYAYGRIQPGAYWYDPDTGWWGVDGGPARGRIDPGLPLGEPYDGELGSGNGGYGYTGSHSDYGGGNGGTIDRGPGGTYGSDGTCYYISTDAGDVLGPGC